jgi:Protein of unknown function (DUF3574)
MRLVFAAVLSFLTLVAATTGSNAQSGEPSCYGGQQPRKIAELLFGRDIGHRVGVDETDWARFVERELIPRFPDGLTVNDTIGQWRSRTSNVIVREPGKRVEIVLPGNADDQARLDAVVTAYKRAFRQRSVIIIEQSACVAF